MQLVDYWFIVLAVLSVALVSLRVLQQRCERTRQYRTLKQIRRGRSDQSMGMDFGLFALGALLWALVRGGR